LASPSANGAARQRSRGAAARGGSIGRARARFRRAAAIRG